MMNELKLDWWIGRLMKHFFFEQQEEHRVGRALAYIYLIPGKHALYVQQ